MFFVISLASCNFFYLRMYETDNFVSGKIPNMPSPTLGKYDTADKFEIKKSKRYEQNEFWIENKPGSVLDIAGSATDLIYYAYHGGSNQSFQVLPINFEGVFQLSNRSLCITYKEEKLFFVLTDCNESNNNQLFEFLECDKFDKYISNGGSTAGNPVLVTETESIEILSDKYKNNGFKQNSTYKLIKDLHDAILGFDKNKILNPLYLGGRNLLPGTFGLNSHFGACNNIRTPFNNSVLGLDSDKFKRITSSLFNVCSLL